jgi:hypothetical protein
MLIFKLPTNLLTAYAYDCSCVDEIGDIIQN